MCERQEEVHLDRKDRSPLSAEVYIYVGGTKYRVEL